jgi:hypothetical protein
VKIKGEIIMDEIEKEELKIKLLFLIDIILLVGILWIGFKIITLNNMTTVWMVEHGGIK